MSRRVGIEIAGGEYRVAVVQVGLGAPRVQYLARISTDEPTALTDLLRGTAEIRVGFPLARVTHRILNLPFRRAAQVNAVAPLELLHQLPQEPDDAVVATTTIVRDAAGTTLLAAVTHRRSLNALLAALPPRSGCPYSIDLAGAAILAALPRAVTDVVVVVAEPDAVSVCVRAAGRLVGLRAIDPPALDADATIAALAQAVRMVAGQPAVVVLAGGAASDELAAGLGAALEIPVTRFAATAPTQAPFAPALRDACAGALGLALSPARARLTFPQPGDPERPAWARRTVGWAVAAGILGLLDIGLYHHRLTTEDHAIAAAMVAEASEILPTPDPQLSPLAQLEAVRQRRRGPTDTPEAPVIELLRDTSARIPTDLPLQIDELRVDGEHLRLHGYTDSYEHVDALRRALGSSPLLTNAETTDTRAGVDGRRVEFTLQASRQRSGGRSS